MWSRVKAHVHPLRRERRMYRRQRLPPDRIQKRSVLQLQAGPIKKHPADKITHLLQKQEIAVSIGVLYYALLSIAMKVTKSILYAAPFLTT